MTDFSIKRLIAKLVLLPMLTVGTFAHSVHNTEPEMQAHVEHVNTNFKPARKNVSTAIAPLRNLVAKGESEDSGNWNAANNGYAMDLGHSGLKAVFGRDCSNITIGEILQAQRSGQVHAVGRYQIIGKTLPAAVKHAGLSSSDKFSPHNQNLLFLALVKNKRPAIWAYLMGRGSIDAAADALAKEWASMPMANGRTYYPNGNRAHATRQEVISTLEAIKSKISI